MHELRPLPQSAALGRYPVYIPRYVGERDILRRMCGDSGAPVCKCHQNPLGIAKSNRKGTPVPYAGHEEHTGLTLSDLISDKVSFHCITVHPGFRNLLQSARQLRDRGEACTTEDLAMFLLPLTSRSPSRAPTTPGMIVRDNKYDNTLGVLRYLEIDRKEIDSILTLMKYRGYCKLSSRLKFDTEDINLLKLAYAFYVLYVLVFNWKKFSGVPRAVALMQCNMKMKAYVKNAWVEEEWRGDTALPKTTGMSVRFASAGQTIAQRPHPKMI